MQTWYTHTTHVHTHNVAMVTIGINNPNMGGYYKLLVSERLRRVDRSHTQTHSGLSNVYIQTSHQTSETM